MKLILRLAGVIQPAVAGTPDHDLWSLTYDCQEYEVRTDEEIAAQLWTARSDPRAQYHSRSHSAYLRADPPLLLLPLTLITCNTYLLPCLLAC